MGPQIVDCGKDARRLADLNGIYKGLGDCLMVIGGRTARRIYYPMELISVANELKDVMPVAFTGKNAFLFYNQIIAKTAFKFNLGGKTNHVQQSVFHAMFGTVGEDFGILQSITNENSFATRKEITDIYSKDGKIDHYFMGIHFNYISKLASAGTVKSDETMQPMLANSIVFAGKRKRHFSGALMKYLESGENATAFGRDSMSLSYALTTFRDKLRKKIDSGELTTAGR